MHSLACSSPNFTLWLLTQTSCQLPPLQHQHSSHSTFEPAAGRRGSSFHQKNVQGGRVCLPEVLQMPAYSASTSFRAHSAIFLCPYQQEVNIPDHQGVSRWHQTVSPGAWVQRPHYRHSAPLIPLHWHQTLTQEESRNKVANYLL